jgi:hypothetical protein
MLDAHYTITPAERSGRASRGEDVEMARRRYQTGCLFIRGKKRKKWVARWPERSARRQYR